jgi:hypothetical protein
MAGMKIISLIDATAKEARADLEAAIQIIDHEITPLQEKVEQLREDVDDLMMGP